MTIQFLGELIASSPTESFTTRDGRALCKATATIMRRLENPSRFRETESFNVPFFGQYIPDSFPPVGAPVAVTVDIAETTTQRRDGNGSFFNLRMSGRSIERIPMNGAPASQTQLTEEPPFTAEPIATPATDPHGYSAEHMVDMTSAYTQEDPPF